MQPVKGNLLARIALLVTVTTLVISSVVLITAGASHGNRTLDVTPDTQTATTGAKAFMTAKLSSPVTSPVNIDFENENGVNDNDGTTRESPDESCVIGAGLPSESASPSPSPTPTTSPSPTPEEDLTQCTVAYIGTKTGNDNWRVWIDHDGRNSSVEADTSEGQTGDTSQTTAGTGGSDCSGAGSDDAEGKLPLGEPDCTDVVTVSWTAATAETLDCDDASGDDTETNPSGGSGSSETYTCVIRDENGNTTNNTVRGEVENGVNDPDDQDGASYDSPDYACHAVSNGTCDITVTQNEGEIGTAQICFWVEQPGQSGSALCGSEPTNEQEGNDLADQVEKTWTASTGSPGTGSPTSTRSPTRTTTPTATSTGTSSPTSTSTSSPTQSESPTTSPPDEGETRRFRTTLTIKRVRRGFKGSVKSDNRRCRSFRLVTVKKKRPGKDRAQGQDSSNRRGRWAVRQKKARGKYYAVAARKVFTARNGDRIVCRRGRSRVIRVRRR